MADREYHTVARLGEIAEGSARSYWIEGKRVVIFHCDDTYYAMADACPHQGRKLSQGQMECGVVQCSGHGWRFRLVDGREVDRPQVRVRTYGVRIRGDEIQVAFDTQERPVEAYPSIPLAGEKAIGLLT